jgi:hypothetical protein
LTEIRRIQPEGEGRHREALRFFAEAFARKGLVVLISDFLEAEDVLPASLRLLNSARHECIAFHVLDPDEIHFPFTATTRFFDSERGGQIVTSPPAVRADYVAAMTKFREGVRAACLDSQVDYVPAETSGSLGDMLAAYLHRRGAVY